MFLSSWPLISALFFFSKKKYLHCTKGKYLHLWPRWIKLHGRFQDLRSRRLLKLDHSQREQTSAPLGHCPLPCPVINQQQRRSNQRLKVTSGPLPTQSRHTLTFPPVSLTKTAPSFSVPPQKTCISGLWLFPDVSRGAQCDVCGILLPPGMRSCPRPFCFLRQVSDSPMVSRMVCLR